MDLNALGFAFLAAVSVGGIAYVFLYPILSGDARAEKRQKAVAGVSTDRLATSNPRQREMNRRDQVAQSLKEIEAREKARHKLTLDARILQAGLTIPKEKFLMICAASGVLTAIVSFIVTKEPLFTLAGLFAGAFGLPFWLLSFLRGKRIDAFVNEFPNAMDVIVRGVKAGLPLGDCLRIIANEASEPVKSEFRMICETQTLGVPLSEAVGRMYERVPVAEANFFGIVIAIQSKAGGNLSEALNNLSRVLRDRKKMKGKIKAMSMEAKASAAIIAALPVVVGAMLSVSTPKYVELLWVTETGKLSLAISAFWMFLGVMVMRKMINFDF